MKIFANKYALKTKSESEDETRRRRYTDSAQNVNMSRNEMTFIIARAAFGEMSIERVAEHILPPSKLYMGSILRVPRASDEVINP